MDRERAARTSPEQFTALIEFMERHGDLSKPQVGLHGRLRGDLLWTELTERLNLIGEGADKSLIQWKKVWADWKSKTKQKYASLKKRASSSGRSFDVGRGLGALEERVVAIMQGRTRPVDKEDIDDQTYSTPSPPRNIPSPHEGEIVIKLEMSPNNVCEPVLSPSPSPPPPTAQSPSPSAPQSPSPPTPDPDPEQPMSPTARQRLRLKAARRYRGQAPFERAASGFVSLELRRLQLEESRELRMHERELERLRVERERIQVTREQNQLLKQLGVVAQRLLDYLARGRA